MILNAEVDERALREIYLTGFEIAVKEGKPGALMTSYNQVNGLQSNENPQLMLEILRKEWGYDGMVVTDWGGSDDHIRGIQRRIPAVGDSRRRRETGRGERGVQPQVVADALLFPDPVRPVGKEKSRQSPSGECPALPRAAAG